jgi:hypothetical protein
VPSTASSNKLKRAEEDLPAALPSQPDSLPPSSTAGNVATTDSAHAEDSSALEEPLAVAGFPTQKIKVEAPPVQLVAAAAPRRHHLAPSRLNLQVTAHPARYCR